MYIYGNINLTYRMCAGGRHLIATTKELSRTEKTGLYLITITNQDKKNIAYFKGTVYRTSKEWLLEDE